MLPSVYLNSRSNVPRSRLYASSGCTSTTHPKSTDERDTHLQIHLESQGDSTRHLRQLQRKPEGSLWLLEHVQLHGRFCSEASNLPTSVSKLACFPPAPQTDHSKHALEDRKKNIELSAHDLACIFMQEQLETLELFRTDVQVMWVVVPGDVRWPVLVQQQLL